jgi:type I restriction enzyme S subunit
MTDDTDNGWKLYKVSDFAEVVGGGTPSTSVHENFGDDIPWITPKDLSMHRTRYIVRGERSLSLQGLASSSAKRLPAGTVLVSSRAPIGLTAIAQNEVSTNQGCRSLVLRPDLADSEFVYYLMSASTDYLHQHANGTTFMELPGGVFKNLEFMLPPLDEQRRIAEVLGVLDDRIDLSRSLVSCLEDAIANEAAATLQDASDVTQLLTAVATIVNGYSYKSSELVDESDTAMVNLKNFGRYGGFRLDGLKPFEGTPKPTQVLVPGDAMVAKTDLTQGAEVIGRCLRMPALPQFRRYVASLDIAIIRSKGQLPQLTLCALLAQQEFRDHCLGFVNGTTVLHMSKAAFETYTIPVLDDGQIASLTNRVETLAAQQDRTLIELHHLQEMRDFLLPRLVAGEMRVKAAEDLAEASL